MWSKGIKISRNWLDRKFKLTRAGRKNVVADVTYREKRAYPEERI
jgi:hypothetical protein